MLDVGLEIRGGKVAGEAMKAGFGRGVGLEEGGEGGEDAGFVGGRDGDVGAMFEGGFGDGVADPGATADDEDAFGVEFEGVFLGVCHDGGGGEARAVVLARV